MRVCDCQPWVELTSKEGEVIRLQLAQRWLGWGNASDMDYRGVAIKDTFIRRQVSGWKPPPHPTPPCPLLNSPPSCDRKPSCFQIVWFRWIPNKQPIETAESSVWSSLFWLTFWKHKTETWNLPSIHNESSVRSEAWVETVRRINSGFTVLYSP